MFVEFFTISNIEIKAVVYSAYASGFNEIKCYFCMYMYPCICITTTLSCNFTVRWEICMKNNSWMDYKVGNLFAKVLQYGQGLKYVHAVLEIRIKRWPAFFTDGIFCRLLRCCPN